MSPAIQAIIFDADGTLVDSELAGLDVMRAVARLHGLSLTREYAHTHFRGVRMAHSIAWITSQLGRTEPGFEEELTRQVRKATEARFRQGLAALPGAHALLQGLKIPFCVATNGPLEKVELTLTLTKLRPFFGDRIFSAYEVGSFKPEPGLFLHAAAALGVAPPHCAVVEDSLPGVMAGLEAGMQVFCLHPRLGIESHIAQRVTFIDKLAALQDYLVPA